MQEEWRPVVGYEGLYQVSNKGRVKSLERNFESTRMGTPCTIIVREKILKNNIGNHGYFVVGLYKYNKMKLKTVHSLVCEAFIGERPDGYDICHRDGNKLNNNLENLRYDSHKNNHQDMKLNNTWPSREKNGKNKLTENEVQQIYLLLKNTKITYKEIGEKYSVHKTTIININKGINWHLDSISYPIRKVNKYKKGAK